MRYAREDYLFQSNSFLTFLGFQNLSPRNTCVPLKKRKSCQNNDEIKPQGRKMSLCHCYYYRHASFYD